jgi:hypothetical protein
MDLKIINVIFKCGRILSITPSSTSQRNLNNFEKLYGYLIFATVTSFTWYNMFWTGVSNSYLTYSQYILAVAGISIYTMHNFYVFIIIRLQKHSQWFKLLQRLEYTQYLYHLQFVMSHLIALSVIVVNNYLYLIYYDTTRILFNLIMCIEFYLQYFYLVLRYIILEMLLSRYHHQNNLLQRATLKNFPKIPKRTKQDLFILEDAVKIFNDIFGWASLLDIFSTAIRTLITLDIAVKKDLNFELFVVIFQFMFLLLYWYQIEPTLKCVTNNSLSGLYFGKCVPG